MRMVREWQVRRRMNRIRQREKVGEKVLPEPLRESRARELFVRKMVLPKLKQSCGNSVIGVVLIGSAQRSIRRATRSRPSSDVDIWVVIDEESEFYKTWHKIKKLESALSKKVGFRYQIGISKPMDFANILTSDSWKKEPFQIVFGQATLMKMLEQHYARFSENPREALANDLRGRKQLVYTGSKHRGS